MWDMLPAMNVVEEETEEKDVQVQSDYILKIKGPPNPQFFLLLKLQKMIP
jgi:hypothetical protein